jgi:hypothetical protein
MTDASKPAPRVWSEGRIVFWFVLFVVTLLVFGPPYLEAFRPPESKVGDFHQEWLSARNFAEGGRVYENQRVLVAKYLNAPPEIAQSFLPWNAHPPPSAVLALPLGRCSYSQAQLLWNLANLPLLALTLVVIIRELRVPFAAPSVFPLGILLVGWHSLYSQIQHAQLNILLMTCVTLTWALARNGRSWAAGAALGVAAAIKLFPAFLFLYFLATRNLRALIAGALVILLLNGVTVVILGFEDILTYIRDVIPSLANYQSSRQNVSLAGFWLRIFQPHPNEHIQALYPNKMLGVLFSYGSRIALAGLVAWTTAIARTPGERDRAFALAVLALLLVSPIAWPHYFLILSMPLAWLWMNINGRFSRTAFWLAFALLWLPNYYFPSLVLGKETGMIYFLQGTSEVTPFHNLVLMSLPHYALVGLFLLAYGGRTAPVDTVPPPSES